MALGTLGQLEITNPSLLKPTNTSLNNRVITYMIDYHEKQQEALEAQLFFLDFITWKNMNVMSHQVLLGSTILL